MQNKNLQTLLFATQKWAGENRFVSTRPEQKIQLVEAQQEFNDWKYANREKADFIRSKYPGLSATDSEIEHAAWEVYSNTENKDKDIKLQGKSLGESWEIPLFIELIKKEILNNKGSLVSAFKKGREHIGKLTGVEIASRARDNQEAAEVLEEIEQVA